MDGNTNALSPQHEAENLQLSLDKAAKKLSKAVRNTAQSLTYRKVDPELVAHSITGWMLLMIANTAAQARGKDEEYARELFGRLAGVMGEPEPAGEGTVVMSETPKLFIPGQD